jgi:hypothetical protein
MATTNNCLSPKDKTWMGFKTIALLHNHSRNCPPVIWPVLWSNDGGRKCRFHSLRVFFARDYRGLASAS